jgi:SAM-dependent methyltransferase
MIWEKRRLINLYRILSRIISYRRKYLDAKLNKYKYLFRGKCVLEVGAEPSKRRGNFRPPTDAQLWHTLNRSGSLNVDIVAELPTLPVADKEYDVVLCTEVMEYLDDPVASLNEMIRILKDDGTLILTVPFIHPLHGDAEADKFRFTFSFIDNFFDTNFRNREVIPMGGVYASVYDLLYIHYRKTGIAWLLLSPLALIIKLFDRPNIQNTTGFFIIANTPKN